MIHKQKYCSEALSRRCIWNGIHFTGMMILRSPGNADTLLKLRADMFQSKIRDQTFLSNKRYMILHAPPAKATRNFNSHCTYIYE